MDPDLDPGGQKKSRSEKLAQRHRVGTILDNSISVTLNERTRYPNEMIIKISRISKLLKLRADYSVWTVFKFITLEPWADDGTLAESAPSLSSKQHTNALKSNNLYRIAMHRTKTIWFQCKRQYATQN